MKLFLGLLLILSSTISYSQTVSVEELYTELKSYQCTECTHRNPYLSEYNDQWVYGVKHVTKIDLLKSKNFNLNFDTNYYLDGVDKVRFVGLEYEGSLTYKRVTIGRFHNSSHGVDQSPHYKQAYPLTDAWFFRFNWIKK